MGSKNKKLNLDKDKLYDLYINQRLTSKEIGDIFNCSSKSVRNYLKAYNIPVRPNGEAVKLERSKWSSEKEKARSLKFMKTWQNTPDDIKHEIINKRTKNINSPEAIKKSLNTKLKNNTFIKSKAENEFYKKLCVVFTDYDVVHGYSDDRYPFMCDFYIKSKDLFIEYQGHQTHGYEPYDKHNNEHFNYLNYMESHNNDMSTWTTRDPLKLKTALKNKINLLLIYPKNDSYLVKNGLMTNVGKINAVDISDID